MVVTYSELTPIELEVLNFVSMVDDAVGVFLGLKFGVMKSLWFHFVQSHCFSSARATPIH